MVFYRVDMPASLIGATVRDAVELVKSRHDQLFVGVFAPEGAVLNPPATRVLTAEDGLLVIAAHQPTLM